MTYYDPYEDYQDYTAADARRDEAQDQFEEVVRECLNQRADKVVSACLSLRAEIDERGYDEPHPWTWDRHLLGLMEEDEVKYGDGEYYLREMLDDLHRDEAEEEANDSYDPGPCCRDFSCPCGG